VQKLLEGARRFQSAESARYRSLFQRLAEEGQHPHTLFITCADSRVVAELVTDSQPGELFVVKNLGNIVPPASIVGMTNSTAAAIEFAVDVLRVEDLVVCGHSHCGAMNALLHQSTDDRRLPNLANWLELADSVRQRIWSQYQNSTDIEECLRAAEKWNVLLALDNLSTYPKVRARLEEGSLRLHGWFFDIARGALLRHDANSGQFVPFAPESNTEDAMDRTAPCK